MGSRALQRPQVPLRQEKISLESWSGSEILDVESYARLGQEPIQIAAAEPDTIIAKERLNE